MEYNKSLDVVAEQDSPYYRRGMDTLFCKLVLLTSLWFKTFVKRTQNVSLLPFGPSDVLIVFATAFAAIMWD